jgi:glycosyltransferase involved in cell wall biosynthesis
MMKMKNKPRRVLMTADAVGGVWQYALRLSRSLQAYDVEVHLATMGPSPDEQQRAEAAAISNLKLYECSYKLEWMTDPWEEIEQASMWLLYLEQEIRPDVVHLNNYVFGELPWDCPVIVVAHSCVLSWWQSVKDTEAPAAWQTYRQRVSKGLQSADQVVAVSQYMADQLQTYYGPLENIQVIHNGLENDYLPGEKKPEAFCMGRVWDEGKNIQIFRQAGVGSDWPLYLAGDGGEQMFSNITGLHYLGKLDAEQVYNHLRRVSVYISPARYEPFGLAVLEAAAHGCALLLSDIPAYREIWGEAAHYFDPLNPDSLQNARKALESSPEMIAEMGEKAYQRSLKYGQKVSCAAYMQLYVKLFYQLNQNERINSSYAN